MYQYFGQLQTGWSHDQGHHKWALILALACLPLGFHFNKLFQVDADRFIMAAILYPRLQWVNNWLLKAGLTVFLNHILFLTGTQKANSWLLCLAMEGLKYRNEGNYLKSFLLNTVDPHRICQATALGL